MADELDVFACPLDGIRLVEASAGTGKTWTLCALVMRLLLERGLPLPRILVVTFTNAATAELRERIRARVVETLEVLDGRGPGPGPDRFVPDLLRRLHALGHDDATLRRRLDEALQGFDEAAIHTIHGLCQRALADNAFSAGVPMAQELLADDADLRLQAAQDFWRRRIAGDALPPALAACLLQAGDSPNRWADLLRQRLARPLARLVWPEDLDDTLPDTSALQAAFEQARALWQAARTAIVDTVAEARPRLNGNVYRETAIAAAIAGWDRLLGADDPMADADDRRLALFGAAKLVPKKGQQPPAPHPFFACADELLARRRDLAQSLALARLRLLRDFLDEAPVALREAKQARRVLGFDDLLAQLHARLHGPGGDALAAALRTRYPAALIDEFQDTDPLQFAIFQRVYQGTGLPLVLLGDPKQAIYSFRGADLHTYLGARRIAVAEHTLAENQRSAERLLQALNGLFGRQPRAFLQPGLHARPVRRGAKLLPAFADRSAGPGGSSAAALQLWSLPPGEDGEPLAKGAAQARAAAATAGEIARLLAAASRGEVTIGDRPLGAGDIAVLVRTHREGAMLRRALANQGVGCVELSQASVFHSAEAEELDRVLAAVREPTREPLVRAALATGLMGLGAAAIDALAADEDAWLQRLAAFGDDHRCWLDRGVAVMLRRWWMREGVAARLLARPDGERRLTNLLHLADLLQQAAGEHPGPEALHRWLQARRQEARADEAAQLRLESDRHLVQIVTIHKSKGLEYPLVFCPFLWDGAASERKGRADEGLAYHDDEGRQVLDFAAALDDDRAADAQARVAQEAAAEQLRLAYVALTRAVYRCTVVVGSYRSARSTRQAGRSAMAWLLAGDPAAAASWPQQALDPAGLQAAAAAFAAEHGLAVSLSPVPADPVPPLVGQDGDSATLAALAPPSPLPSPWWIASYSALMAAGSRRAAGDDAAAPLGATSDATLDPATADHDLHLADDAPLTADALTAPIVPRASPGATGAAAPLIPPDDILRFPRGPLAGECLHAVFEHADFAEPASWPAAIDAALQARPQPASDPQDRARQPAMLRHMLGDVLSTPLPMPPGAALSPLRLDRVAAARRRAELEFTLPVARLSADDLDRALQRLGWPSPPLDFGVLRGYLRGFIDLVFEHEGRFGLLDWKSNHLGLDGAAYGAPRVADAVHAHGYHLQALLYLLALHRWLRHRLPGYDYDRHVAGAWVLFVRGVRPGWIDTRTGQPAGVWVARPPRAVIEDLSDRLDDPAIARHAGARP